MRVPSYRHHHFDQKRPRDALETLTFNADCQVNRFDTNTISVTNFHWMQFTGYTASRGWDCHYFTSHPYTVTIEISMGDTSVPYISVRCCWIYVQSRYRNTAKWSCHQKLIQRIWCLGMICGSKLLWRPRGILMSNSPNSPFRVLRLLPFLGIGTVSCLSWPRYSDFCLAGHVQSMLWWVALRRPFSSIKSVGKMTIYKKLIKLPHERYLHLCLIYVSTPISNLVTLWISSALYN